MNKTLYKLDSKNCIREWFIAIDYDSECLIIEHGRLACEKQIVHEPVEENLSGRTIEEQLELEYYSRIKKKRDTGYCDSIEQAKGIKGHFSNGYPIPMKAHRIDKYGHKIDWNNPVYIQPKYNGHRCLIGMIGGEVVAITLKGLEITTIGHIKDEIARFMNHGLWFDGELYIHGEALQSITSLIKRQQPDSKKLRYIVYDAILTTPYQARLNCIGSLFHSGYLSFIQPATTMQIHHEKDIQHTFKLHKQNGYEGSIVRHGLTGYEPGKRSYSLLKVKGCIDDEFQVVDIETTKLGWAVLVCKVRDSTFKVTAHGSIENKKKIARERGKHIGRIVKVEFAEYTKDGLPFHAVSLGWFDEVSL